jgi:hypothetical protein
MVYKNLVSGQYQIGELVMGRGTTILVNEFDAQAYDINAQDYQVGMSDEIRFGQDQFKPTTIQMKMSVLYNELLDIFKSDNPNFWKDQPRIEHLAATWRADYARKRPGEMVPFYICGKNGEERIVFGRPGQFSASKLSSSLQGQSVECVAEFRRADIFSYSIEEKTAYINKNDKPTEIVRTEGDAPSWMRLIAVGPMTNPVFNIGESEVRLNYTLKKDDMLEISSYPWQRRMIDSNRVNLASYATGIMPYLDRLMIPANSTTAVRWTSEEINTWVPDFGNQDWETDIDDHKLFQLPTTFTTLAGKAAIRLDIFNFGSPQFPWVRPKTYIGAGVFADKTAVLYNAKQYNTAEQFAQAKIVEPQRGKSAIVIMSNSGMTNYACLIVESSINGRWLRIATGNSPTNVTVRASWQNTGIIGWQETDTVSIEYQPSTKTYIGCLNGVAVIAWDDTSEIVNTRNRSQGFLFDIDGNLFTAGVGFNEIICYDKAIVPAPTGQVLVLWRDAWGAIP